MKRNPTISLSFTRVLVLTIASVLFSGPLSFAQEAAKESAKKATPKTEKKPDSDSAKKSSAENPEPSVTHGQLPLPDGTGKFAYTATAGTITLEDSKGDPSATVFHVAYTSKDPDPRRPVIFCFNGGPGSSAVWLHLGALGPKRVNLPGKGTRSADPPYRLIANPHSILAEADLVFVDPVSTGFSRPESAEKRKDFHGFREDIESTGEFIRLWISKNGRWGSPKFLLGESYGAIRVSGLSDHLQSRHGMYLNGVVLLSGVIDFRTISARGGNDLPYVAFLPHLAASAFYHGKLDASVGASVEEVIARSREFAEGTYAQALQAGDRLAADKRAEIVTELALLTALPEDVIDRAGMRISASVFRKMLLRDSDEVLGRFDARVKLPAHDRLRISASFDPSWDVAHGAYATAMNRYLHETLKYAEDDPYEIIGRVHPWSYEPFENSFVQVGSDLASAMVSNPSLKVLVNCGHYDLATPPTGIESSIARLELPTSIRRNLSFTYYDGGHMFYTNPEALAKFRTDLSEFLKASGGGLKPKKSDVLELGK